MFNTCDGMYEYKPYKCVNVCTAFNQKLSELGFGKIH